MISDARRQLSSSAASCFFPARVIEYIVLLLFHKIPVADQQESKRVLVGSQH
jgi:hypothetical protein